MGRTRKKSAEGDPLTDRFYYLFFEREKGFEPSTSTSARWHSTTELLPQSLAFSTAASQVMYLARSGVSTTRASVAAARCPSASRARERANLVAHPYGLVPRSAPGTR